MIQAKFEASKGEIRMKLSGHAGFAEKGKDLICAAATAYAYMVASRMQYADFEKKLHAKPFTQLEEGNIVISVLPKDEHVGEVLNTFFDAQVGMKVLETNYPEYVKVFCFEKISN